MKKVFAILAACMFICAAILPAAAAEELSPCEEEVIKALKTEMETVNGRVVLPSRDIAQFRRFFQKYEMTEADCAALKDALDGIRAILRPLQYTSYEEVPAEQREALRQELVGAAAAMGAEFRFQNGKFSMVRDGAPVFEESVKVIVPVKPNENVGVSIAIVVLLLGGVAFSVIGSKKFEAGK